VLVRGDPHPYGGTDTAVASCESAAKSGEPDLELTVGAPRACREHAAAKGAAQAGGLPQRDSPGARVDLVDLPVHEAVDAVPQRAAGADRMRGEPTPADDLAEYRGVVVDRLAVVGEKVVRGRAE